MRTNSAKNCPDINSTRRRSNESPRISSESRLLWNLWTIWWETDRLYWTKTVVTRMIRLLIFDYRHDHSCKLALNTHTSQWFCFYAMWPLGRYPWFSFHSYVKLAFVWNLFSWLELLFIIWALYCVYFNFPSARLSWRLCRLLWISFLKGMLAVPVEYKIFFPVGKVLFSCFSARSHFCHGE